VQGVGPGDAVFCTGSHRSFQRCKANRVVRLPTGLDPAVGVLTRLMAISMTTLSTTKARPPALVLVVGLGPVGNLAAQVFAACGYRVVGCDPVEARRTLLSRCGIDTAPSDGPFDLVVDCSGHEGAVVDACKKVRRGGEVVLVGVPWAARTELSAHALLHAVFHHYVVLRSGWEWELPMDAGDHRPASIMGNLAAGLDWLHRGRVRADGIASPAAPEDAQSAYVELRDGQSRTLTRVFEWR
jgi:threonine dehydrogenase-like Zn-dependent dehydrogenase